MKSCIEFFDKWYIITIDNKNDNRITNMLQNINVSNFEIVRYKPVTKIINVNKNNSLYELISHNSWDETSENIFQNHLLTIEKGIRENRRNIVILEDDAIINTTTSKLYRLANWLEQNNNNWDIFFLGHCPWPPISLPVNSFIVKPFFPMLAHAYIINGRSMKNVLNNFKQYKKTHFDKIFSLTNFKMYACFPSISCQTKPPAIFKEIMERINLNMDFNKLCYILEILSIILTFTLTFILILLLVYIIYKVMN